MVRDPFGTAAIRVSNGDGWASGSESGRRGVGGREREEREEDWVLIGREKDREGAR